MPGEAVSEIVRTFNVTFLLVWYRLVLRILPPDDPEDIVHMGIKFGSTVANGKRLLDLAKSLELDVIGIR